MLHENIKDLSILGFGNPTPADVEGQLYFSQQYLLENGYVCASVFIWTHSYMQRNDVM